MISSNPSHLAQADREDLERARTGESECEANPPWYKCLGPGLITGAADDDPAGVGTYSANGAQFGYGLLWLVPFCIPLMIAVQEMCGRLALQTGKGFAANIKSAYSSWVLVPVVLGLLFANVFNIYADLNMMAATLQMLTGLPPLVGLTIFTLLLVVTQILVPYRLYASILKWLCLALAGYVAVVFLPGMKNDWTQIAKSTLIPGNVKAATIMPIVAFLGTTISPYLFFWQAGETIEEEVAEGKADKPGKRVEPVRPAEIRKLRTDTVIGMITSQVVAFFIIVASAGTLHASGKTHIENAQDAAKALEPLGHGAVWVFGLCMIGTGLIAIPTLAGSGAYAVAEARHWKYGLYRRFSRATGFYVVIALSIVVGAVTNAFHVLSPVDGLVISGAINGVVAPPLIFLLLKLCNDESLMGARKNRLWSNIGGWATGCLMTLASAYLIASIFMNKPT